MQGRAAVTMWWDVPPEALPEWEDWHTTEHMPERVGIPGFLRGSRWRALSGEPSYFVLYEAVRLATITAGPYLERLNNPTEWSKRMMPNHRNMVRSLCRVRAGFGGGLGHALATIRFSPGERKALPELRPRKGVTGMHLLESHSDVPQTAEQKMRGGSDARADWVLVLRGYDADAVRAAATEHGALPGAVTDLYRLSFAMTSRDLAR